VRNFIQAEHRVPSLTQLWACDCWFAVRSSSSINQVNCTLIRMKQRKRKCSWVETHNESEAPIVQRKRNGICPWDTVPPEVASRILCLLTVQDLFRLREVDRRFKALVDSHLAVTKVVSFCTKSDTVPWAQATGRVTDNNVAPIFAHFSRVEEIRGLSFSNISFRRVTRSLERSGCLSYRGLIWAFRNLPYLRRVSTNDIALATWIMSTFPRIYVDLSFSGQAKLLTGPVNIPSSVLSNKFWLVNQNLPPFPLRGDTVESVLLESVSLKRRRSTVEYFQIECPNLRQLALRRNCYDANSCMFTFRVLHSVARCSKLEELELSNIDCTPGELEAIILDETRVGAKPFDKLRKLTLSECETFSMGDMARLLFACRNSLEELRIDPTFCTSSLLRVLRAGGAVFPALQSLHLGYCGHDSLPWDSPYDAFCRLDDEDLARISALCPQLKEMSLRGCAFLHDATLWKGDWSGLETLQVAYCGMLNVNTVAEFVNTKCPSLRHLALHCVTPATEDAGPVVSGEGDATVQDNEKSEPNGYGEGVAEGQPHAAHPPVAKKDLLRRCADGPRAATRAMSGPLAAPSAARAQLSVDETSGGTQGSHGSASSSSPATAEESGFSQKDGLSIRLKSEHLSSISLVKSSLAHVVTECPLLDTLRVGHCPLLRTIEIHGTPIEVTLVESPLLGETLSTLPKGSLVLAQDSPAVRDIQPASPLRRPQLPPIVVVAANGGTRAAKQDGAASRLSSCHDAGGALEADSASCCCQGLGRSCQSYRLHRRSTCTSGLNQSRALENRPAMLFVDATEAPDGDLRGTIIPKIRMRLCEQRTKRSIGIVLGRVKEIV
ncbi:F-box only protein 38-like, partial [Tropilaelaps mercedesae]